MEHTQHPLIEPKCDPLHSLITQLAEKFTPLQIYSLPVSRPFEPPVSCSRLDRSPLPSHHCLLLVTQTNARIDHQAQDYASRALTSGTVSILCYGSPAIQTAMEYNSRFFIQALSKGRLCYSAAPLGFDPQQYSYDPSDAAKKAQQHFAHHFGLSEGFFTGAGSCLANGQNKVCAFLLHQVTEQACIAMARVILGYRSEFHNLRRLLELCRSFSDLPYSLLIGPSKDEQQLFDILGKSYSQARYLREFKVTHHDANHLYEKITDFLALSHQLCQQRISELSQVSYQSTEREVSHG